MKNKIIDLFCGCGGLSRGFEEAGFEVVLAIDNWQDAVNTYNFNHKNPVGSCQDIHNIKKEFLDDLNKDNEIVGIIGGPPCQGYSTVGTRDVNDPRNHLYLEYCRIVATVMPEFFIIENVKGLTTLNNGMFKNDIINRFENLGYLVSYKTVNAADFGIPQNRHRVIFVGMKKKRFEFPNKVYKRVSSEEAICDLPKLSERDVNKKEFAYQCEPDSEYQNYMRGCSQKILNHEVTMHSEQTKKIIEMIKDGGKISELPPEYWNIRKYNKAFQRMNSKLPSNTIDTGHRNYFHYNENRIPTVRESARIQSFKDDFVFLGSRTSQYKQVGNAVPPLLAERIAEAIYAQLNMVERVDYTYAYSIARMF